MRCPTNIQIRKNAKEYYENNIDRYEEARDEVFTDALRDFLGNFESAILITFSQDDLQGFLDSFEFPDEDEWLSNEYESYIGDIEDQCYENFRDEQMFKDK